jgi:hypothetical protein
VRKFYGYLDGGDCSLESWIETNSRTVPGQHERYKAKPMMVKTGVYDVNEARRYVKYYGSEFLAFDKWVPKGDGGECDVIEENPFKEKVYVNLTTDGMQFRQHEDEISKLQLMQNDIQQPVLINKVSSRGRYAGAPFVRYVLSLNQNNSITTNGVGIIGAWDMAFLYKTPSAFTRTRFDNGI